MVKRIKWTRRALNEKLDILNYWRQRNRSRTYSVKLNDLLIEATRLLQKYPSIGRPTTDPEVKHILAKDYLLFYTENETEIIILHVWDERRNPHSMIYKLK